MNRLALLLASSIIGASQISVAIAAEPAATSQSDKIAEYRACLRAYVIIFDQAKESVSDTIDATFYACRNDRALVVLDIYDSRKKIDENASIVVGDEFVTNSIDVPFKEKEFVRLMEKRVQEKNAQN